MSRIGGAICEFQSIDALAREERWTGSIAPLARVFVTVFYIVLLVSFHKYDSAVFGMILYPFILFLTTGLSFKDAVRRLRIVLPLVIVIGIANPFFDRKILFSIGGTGISGGVMSMVTLMLKAALAVLASYLLIATTPIEELCGALRRIHIPQIIVTEILLIYRYITVLLSEARRVTQAYSLRAPGQKGVAFRAWGPLAGQMLLRSMDRAETLYESMQLRGFAGEFPLPGRRISAGRTAAFLVIACASLLILRFTPLLSVIGGIFV